MSSSSKRARSRSCRKRCQSFNCSVRVWRSSTHGACHKKKILAQNSYAYDLGCLSLRSEKVSPVLVLFAFVWQSAGALLVGRHSSTASWASSNWEPVPQISSSSGQKLDWGLCWNCKNRGYSQSVKTIQNKDSENLCRKMFTLPFRCNTRPGHCWNHCNGLRFWLFVLFLLASLCSIPVSSFLA